MTWQSCLIGSGDTLPVALAMPDPGRCPVCDGLLPTNRRQKFCSYACYQLAGNFGERVNDPTPAEIAETCLMIQRTWTEEQRVERMRVDVRPVSWTPPVVSADEPL